MWFAWPKAGVGEVAGEIGKLFMGSGSRSMASVAAWHADQSRKRRKGDPLNPRMHPNFGEEALTAEIDGALQGQAFPGP